MKSLFIATTMLMSAFAASAHDTDSTAVATDTITELKEVVINGQRQRTIKHGVEYYPTKAVKRAASDAASLLLNMQIPQLRVSPVDMAVKTLAGKSVAFYIDYTPASDADLKGMRTEDVMRVEVLEYPSDPRFQSNPYVVNFIMQKYEWGGYTNLTGGGSTLSFDTGTGRLYSKFAYKKMTYALSAGTIFTHNDNIGESSWQQFKDITYDGRHYESIVKSTQSLDDNLAKSNNQWVNFQAVYSVEKILMQHTLSFNRRSQPVYNTAGTVSFTPSVIEGTRSSTEMNSYSAMPTLQGYYWFALPKNSSLSASFSIGLGGNKRSSVYTLAGLDPIVNRNRERTVDASAHVSYSKRMAHANSLTVSLMTYDTRYRTRYMGSFDGLQRLLSSENMLFIEYRQTYAQKLDLFSRVGMSYVVGKVNNVISQRQWNPRLGFQLSYNHNSHHSASIEGWWGNSHPQASSSNSAMVQQSELMWLRGNPDMRNTIFVSSSANYNYIPTDAFSLSANINYEGSLKKQAYDYTTMPGFDGLVRSTVNSGDAHMYKANVSATLKLFENKLIFGAYGSANKTVLTGINACHKGWLEAVVSASYFIKNLSFMAYYGLPSRSIHGWSMGMYGKNPNQYGIRATYGDSRWNVTVSYSNWFRKRGMERSYLINPGVHYASETQSYNGGNYSRYLQLSVSYTIGYGKKINRTNDPGAGSTGTSAILK